MDINGPGTSSANVPVAVSPATGTASASLNHPQRRSTSDSPAPLPFPQRFRRHSSHLSNAIMEDDIKLEPGEEGGLEFDIFDDPNGSESEFIMPSSEANGGVDHTVDDGRDLREFLDSLDDSYLTSRQTSEVPFNRRARIVRDEETAGMLRNMLSPELASPSPSFRAESEATVYGDENRTPPPSMASRSRYPASSARRPRYDTLLRRSASNDVRRSESPRNQPQIHRYRSPSTSHMQPPPTPTPAPRPRSPRSESATPAAPVPSAPVPAAPVPPAPVPAATLEASMPLESLTPALPVETPNTPNDTEIGVQSGAYMLVEHYPIGNPEKYVGNHRVRAGSGVFGHIGRQQNDNGGAIRTGLCKERLGFPTGSLDAAYIQWQAFETDIKSSLETLGIDSLHDSVLDSDRNDHPQGVWIALLNSLINSAEELFLLSPDIVEVLQDEGWSQLRRFYWHALDELVISYVQTAQRKAKKLQKHLEAISLQRGLPATEAPGNRRRLRKMLARTAFTSHTSQQS